MTSSYRHPTSSSAASLPTNVHLNHHQIANGVGLSAIGQSITGRAHHHDQLSLSRNDLAAYSLAHTSSSASASPSTLIYPSYHSPVINAEFHSPRLAASIQADTYRPVSNNNHNGILAPISPSSTSSSSSYMYQSPHNQSQGSSHHEHLYNPPQSSDLVYVSNQNNLSGFDNSINNQTNSNKKHPCQYCTAAFARRHDRDRHERMHTGEKPYVCSQCGKGFMRSDALR